MLIPKFAADDKVFAKLRGYPPWPARVEGVADETPNKIKYHVFFYGTGETAVCKQEELCLYVENKEKYGKPMKKKGFNTALAQIDAELGLGPSDQSPSLDQENGFNLSSSLSEANGKSDTITPVTSKNKSTIQRKRKQLEESNTEALPKKSRKVAKKVITESETPSTSTQQTTSRSGRKITKVKVYSDGSDEEEEPTVRPTTSKSKTTGRQSKINVDAEINDITTKGVETTTPEGQKLTLQLDLKKPRYFKSKRELVQWKSKVLSEVGDLKSKIQSGEISVEEIIGKIKVPYNKTLAKMEQKKSSPENQEKLNYLKMEVKLMDLNLNIRKAAMVENADPDACLRHLDELTSIDIRPLMVKKNPEIVDTLKKLTKYVGKTIDYPEDEAEMFRSKAEAIRGKAKELCDKIKSLFEITSGESFSEVFFKVLVQFRKAVKSLSVDNLILLTSDPTENLNQESESNPDTSEMSTVATESSNVATESSNVATESSVALS